MVDMHKKQIYFLSTILVKTIEVLLKRCYSFLEQTGWHQLKIFYGRDKIMMQLNVLKEEISNGKLDNRFYEVYGAKTNLDELKTRLNKLVNSYEAAFGSNTEVGLFTAPGRTEICGNHTDHQHGCVLAGAINLDAIACAAPNGTNTVRIKSEGYPEIVIDINDFEIKTDEKETSAALVRGVAARITQLGYDVKGFNAVISSTVLGGSGLSSSAAYEVLIGVIFNSLFCGGKLTAVQIAQIGQYAENVYFGKPCGLMDQLASSVGGMVAIDFEDTENPIVKKIDYDFAKSGYSLCIIDSGADHADLTDDYAAIPREMKAVAAYFVKDYLRQVDEDKFWSEIKNIRKQTGDRAVLRAIHFFSDHKHVGEQVEALENKDFNAFLSCVTRSGHSSVERLQNIYCTTRPEQQAVTLTIETAHKLLAGKGAVRVHGGGFAGTVQAYVPNGTEEQFKNGMEAVIGEGCCHFLNIRPQGGVALV